MLSQSALGGDSGLKLKDAWEHVLGHVSNDVSATVANKFLKPLKPLSLVGDKVTILAPGAFVQEWVQEKYLQKMQDELCNVLGEEIELNVIVNNKGKEQKIEDTAQSALIFSKTANINEAEQLYSPDRFQPIPKYQFETFIIGQSNRLAYAGAKAVAKVPGMKYNPLFIYGDSGLGKTHLLHSIAQEILRQNPKYPIVYISAQQFAEKFVHALQNNKIEAFRRLQRNIGVWLVDDIQFIAGKDKTQEEIFHTFNYLHGLGKQIVLCSDRPPRDLYLMDERLRSRFESGLVADIQPPDTETRCAILLSKANQEGIHLDHNIAMLLAEAVPGNIRILEGALIKLAAQASIEDSMITIELARSIIDRYYRQYQLPKPNVDKILEMISNHFRIPIEELRGSSRKAPITHARHIAIYLIRETTKDSWKHIGVTFGDRDHTSIMHAHQKIQEMISKDKELHELVQSFKKNFNLGVLT